MQQIKMIGLDLDGTLLNTKKELTETGIGQTQVAKG